MNVKAVFFDIGNIIFPIESYRCHSLLSEKNIPIETISTLRHLETSWDFEKGKIEGQEFYENVLKEIPSYKKLTEDDFYMLWISILGETYLEIEEIIKDLHNKNILIYSLSNTNSWHAHSFLKRPVFSYFHGHNMSHELGTVKPEDKIYRKALERVKLDPEEVLYIDDLQENLDAAIKIGIKNSKQSVKDPKTTVKIIKDCLPHLFQ